MPGLATTPRLFGLCGSLRRASYSLAVMRSLQTELRPEAHLEIADIRLPLYNEDDDGSAAVEAVRAFRHGIDDSDGVVIVTPEYSHGVPGGLKNALDWASRPAGKSVLTGEPVAIMSVSPAFTGGVRAQYQIHEALLAMQAHIVVGPEVVIGNAADKVRDGRLVDEASLRFALGAIDRMLVFCRGAQHRPVATRH